MYVFKVLENVVILHVIHLNQFSVFLNMLGEKVEPKDGTVAL